MVLRRACTDVDAVVLLSEPIRGTDGGLIGEIPVPKGATLLLNLHACNTNKALWREDAEECKPERWLQPLPRALEQSRIPGIYADLYVQRSRREAFIVQFLTVCAFSLG